uniref:Uncharacterized protein n=1 Tax=Oryza barthii TaxID=65489 RepID=A0A0D3ERF0_9ORYZ
MGAATTAVGEGEEEAGEPVAAELQPHTSGNSAPHPANDDTFELWNACNAPMPMLIQDTRPAWLLAKFLAKLLLLSRVLVFSRTPPASPCPNMVVLIYMLCFRGSLILNVGERY